MVFLLCDCAKLVKAMKKVTLEVLKEATNKLLFDMSDEQYQNLLNEFDIILSQMELISEIDGVDDATPMAFPFEVTNDYLREDESSTPLSKEDALKNAKDVVDGQISIPRVVK